jgi:hypothetical protein
LNAAVDAFAEYDPLVARVLQLTEEQHWPREFVLATISYYLLHRHRDEYRGDSADGVVPLPPVRLTVDVESTSAMVLNELVHLLQNLPPISAVGPGQPEGCLVCHQPPETGHKDDCLLDRLVMRARRVLQAA